MNIFALKALAILSTAVVASAAIIAIGDVRIVAGFVFCLILVLIMPNDRGSSS